MCNVLNSFKFLFFFFFFLFGIFKLNSFVFLIYLQKFGLLISKLEKNIAFTARELRFAKPKPILLQVIFSSPVYLIGRNRPRKLCLVCRRIANQHIKHFPLL